MEAELLLRLVDGAKGVERDHRYWLEFEHGLVEVYIERWSSRFHVIAAATWDSTLSVEGTEEDDLGDAIASVDWATFREP